MAAATLAPSNTPLPLFVPIGSTVRIPRWADTSVAIGLEESTAHLAPYGTPLWRKVLSCRPCIVVGTGLLTSMASQSWHDLGFHAFLRDAGRARSTVLPEGDGARLRRIASDIRQELAGELSGRDSLAVARLSELLVLIYRSGVGDAAPCGAADPIAELVRYIDQHYTDGLTLEDLARRCAMSPTHLSHRFRSEVGKPLFAYINEVRIERACSLLTRSKHSVVEIAYAVGYNSLSFFNRYFRRVTGVSPTEFRRNIGS